MKQLEDPLAESEEEFYDHNELPMWNASHIANIPLDLTHKRKGWGLLYDGKAFSMFPLGEEEFYDHNKLRNYKADQHTPLKEIEDWTKKRISIANEELSKDVKKTLNITLGKEIKKSQKEIEVKLEDIGRDIAQKNKELENLLKSSDVENKQGLETLLRDVKRINSDIDTITDTLGVLGALGRDKTTLTKTLETIATLEKQMSGMIDIKVGKVRDIVYTKGELNQKFKLLSERISEAKKLTKELSTKNDDKDIKETLSAIEDLKLNKADWGHNHLAKEIRYDGQRLDEYLGNLSVGSGSTEDETARRLTFMYFR